MLDAVRAVEQTPDPAQKVRLSARALWATGRFRAVTVRVIDVDTAATDVVQFQHPEDEEGAAAALTRAAARYTDTGRWDAAGASGLRAFPLWPRASRGVIAVSMPWERPLDPVEQLAVARFATAVGVSLEQAWAARRDPLTGCFTGSACRAELKRRLLGSPSRPLGVVYCDMDDLKRINDRWGHAAGDRAIGAVARGLQRAAARDLRTRWVGRLHGDEFLVVFWAEPGSDEKYLAESLRTRWRSAVPGVSFGLAIRRAQDDAAALIRRAETSMYAEKGRVRPSRRA